MPRLRGTGMTLWHSLVADLGRCLYLIGSTHEYSRM
jgi:hypothetical protein